MFRTESLLYKKKGRNEILFPYPQPGVKWGGGGGGRDGFKGTGMMNKIQNPKIFLRLSMQSKTSVDRKLNPNHKKINK